MANALLRNFDKYSWNIARLPTINEHLATLCINNLIKLKDLIKYEWG